jgi:asparagine synthase (glutamine-hydrolysing)
MTDVLPPETIGKSKRGFGAPMGAWLKKELRPLMHVVLSPESVAQRGLFDPAVIAETIGLHEAARRDYSDHLQCLLNLEIWCRIFLDGRSCGDVSDELAGHLAGARAA